MGSVCKIGFGSAAKATAAGWKPTPQGEIGSVCKIHFLADPAPFPLAGPSENQRHTT